MALRVKKRHFTNSFDVFDCFSSAISLSDFPSAQGSSITQRGNGRVMSVSAISLWPLVADSASRLPFASKLAMNFIIIIIIDEKKIGGIHNFGEL